MKNKSNSMKIIEQKKVVLKTFENESQNIIDGKHNKNQINNLSKDNKELYYNFEDKENIYIQNSNINKNRFDDFNSYLIQKNKDKLKTYKKIDNLDYYKNNQDNKNIVYSKDIHNNNSNISNRPISLKMPKNYDNKNNFGVKKYIKKYSNKTNTYNNKEEFLTERYESNINNHQFTKKNNEHNLLNSKPLTEREYNKGTQSNKDNDPNNNYLLPIIKPGKKTLILDLDETLIHSSFKPFNIQEDFKIKINSSKLNNKSQNNNKNQYIIYVLKRPYVGVFLSIVCEIFEVVVFTASLLEYANPIIDLIDIENKIKYRLFREHCIKIDKDKYIKNLYRLGRDLKNIIIIDNNPFSYALNIENGIPISTWETNQTDNELIRLIPILQYLSRNSISDVRPFIKRIVKNNKINYDEANKIINNQNKNYNYSYFSKEKEKNNNDDKSKIHSYKEIYHKNDVKIPNRNDKNTYKKLEYSDSDIYHLNNSVSNNKKILKNISVNKEHIMFIKKLRNINSNCRGKSENLKPKKIELFLENEEKNTDLSDKKRKLNLSEKYLLNKNDYLKKYINFSDIIKKSKTKDNKTYIDNKKKDISIPLPINYTQFIPINKNKNNIIKKKIYPKKPSRIYLNRNNSKKLIKNNSDFSNNINNNATKEQNSNIIKKLNYPNLKNIFYHKLFYNKFYNKKEINNVPLHSKSISRNKNKDKAIITDNKAPKKSSFHFKGNDINFKETNKTHNYSFEYYLKNKFNLSVLDNNMNNFISRLKINNQKKIINEPKKIYLNIEDKPLKGNNSFKLNRYFYNIIDINKSLKETKQDNTIMKHSFSFLNNNRSINDYISIINRYNRLNNKKV